MGSFEGKNMYKLLQEAHFSQLVHFKNLPKKDGKILLQQTPIPTCNFSWNSNISPTFSVGYCQIYS